MDSLKEKMEKIIKKETQKPVRMEPNVTYKLVMLREPKH